MKETQEMLHVAVRLKTCPQGSLSKTYIGKIDWNAGDEYFGIVTQEIHSPVAFIELPTPIERLLLDEKGQPVLDQKGNTQKIQELKIEIKSMSDAFIDDDEPINLNYDEIHYWSFIPYGHPWLDDYQRAVLERKKLTLEMKENYKLEQIKELTKNIKTPPKKDHPSQPTAN